MGKMKSWKDNVYFVLVEPAEPGNIGAAARAIKNMGFRNLCLVNPPSFMTEEAKWFAHNANDILASASVHGSVSDAISNKHLVIGTSRRRGRRRGAFIPVEQAARHVFETACTNKVAILFGREDRGLFNEEIGECGFLITIPASRSHPSLNLSHAVMVITYELSKNGSSGQKAEPGTPDESLLTAALPRLVNQRELAHLYDRMERALRLIEYIPSENAFLEKKIMSNLKHCFGRTGLTEWEFNMFHGICKQIEKKVNGDGR
jgi:TrmH family RNA methyltransferase